MDKPKREPERRVSNVIPFQVDGAFFFERAVHYLDRHDLKNALKNFRKAVEYEPDNPVHHCNLAGVLSELGDFEESNRILEKILKDIAPDMVECWFYMANNYANLGQYDLSEDYAARYLEHEPEGEFAEDAEEMLQILVQEFGGGKVLEERKKRQEEEQREQDQARRLLEEGRFIEASEYLERAIEQQPDSTAPRNNLSLAYYYLGELDKAIEIAQDVLSRDNSNVHALCNLAVFYQHLGDKENLQQILEGLRKLYPLYFDHTYKLATTMGILGEHATAYRLFRQLLRWSDRSDPMLLHCVAAAAANLGFLEKARKIWLEVEELDPESEIPAFFLKKVNKALEAGKGTMQSVSYQYHIPFNEQFKAMKEQLQNGKLGAWRNDPLVRSSLFWALRHGDLETKMQVIQTFALIADKEVEAALREFLKNADEIDQLKKLALYVLRHMGADGPFEAHLEGEEILLRVEQPSDDLLTLKPEWQEVLTLAEASLQESCGAKADGVAREIWVAFLQRTFHASPRIQRTAPWAAALEYAVRKQLGEKISQAEIAKRYEVSPNSVSRMYRSLTTKNETPETPE
ncbi:tetratricopeptide repeat protein [Tumebacillus sp. DT12]|uniref:Tetratricopeptide repeat protein n=1 Tax=Tumebacillus lacus TaxID=2995335 RepID=A0ABT3X5X1_9BACL|nr:tetratricopeptide repeat protein [Tumebacillus lacus]MCX7571026.1 tetratricopeptide repeat protein [Tumebacillus lacus]